MAQPDGLESAPTPPPLVTSSLLNKTSFRQPSTDNPSPEPDEPRPNRHLQPDAQYSPRPGPDRPSRQVVAGLPRTQTFKRQQSEQRTRLTPIETPPNERRGPSTDRQSSLDLQAGPMSPLFVDRLDSAPSLVDTWQCDVPAYYVDSFSASPLNPGFTDSNPIYGKAETTADSHLAPESVSMADARSMTRSQYENTILEELETKWILNLSMHFRDRSKREKFFVTYREEDYLWRRVTVSLDYRDAPEESLEMDLIHTKYQREKSAKIYEAIRESLRSIQFYDTVTNLKLQTTDGRLHVHVVEDGNEIIQFPPVHQIQHLRCRQVRERDLVFHSHMSGFVYKVTLHGQTFIKKEIPSPDTVEEFLYEINALHSLDYSNNVIKFHGVVVDDYGECVKGLLIGYADQGALIDMIFDNCKESNRGIPWPKREKWARQIVHGLADIHDSGFVQGDFTLSNIVIDRHGDAKIIDINRRGCPVGWEPPEATALIESSYRISMYIGVKSDLYQLGMVLWSLAMLEDEPEAQGRPLMLGPEINIPDWYRQMTEICLSADPRARMQASSLLHMFPPEATKTNADYAEAFNTHADIDDRRSPHGYAVDDYHADSHPIIKTVQPPDDWHYGGRTYVEPSPDPYEPYYVTRGRSPPSPMPSDRCDSPSGRYRKPVWAENRHIPSSYSDVDMDEKEDEALPTPTPTGPGFSREDSTMTMFQSWYRPESTCLDEELVSVADTGIVGGVDISKSDEMDTCASSRMHHDLADDRCHAATADAVDAEPPRAEATTPRALLTVDRAVEGRYQDDDMSSEMFDEMSNDGGVRVEHSVASASLAVMPTIVNDELVKDEVMEAQTHNLTDEVGKENSVSRHEDVFVATNTEEPKASTPQRKNSLPVMRHIETPSMATPEPEYIAPQIAGSTAPDGQVDRADKLPRQIMNEGETKEKEMNERRTNEGAMRQRPAYRDAMQSINNADFHWGTDGPSEYMGRGCRQINIPVTLTGIGSSLLTMDGDAIRERGIIDDDFDLVTRPETVPQFMITTDAKT